MKYSIQEKGTYKYIDEGSGELVLLLHGLFGSMGNFEALITGLKDQYRLVVPLLPIFELSSREISIQRLMEHVADFIEDQGFEKVHLVGNSLGGHIALMLVIKSPDLVQSLTLTGSSGLFENALGSSYPRRQDYNFVKEVAERTFYDPNVASKELVDDIFEIVNNPAKGLNIIITAKSAMRHNMEGELHKIKVPTLLIWGKDDQITPAFVGEDFHQRISRSSLHILERCGHAPMMEHPETFIGLLKPFLEAQAIS